MTSVILIQLVKLRPHRPINLFNFREIKFPHLRLIRNRQRAMQRPRRSSFLARGAINRIGCENPFQIPDPKLAPLDFLQELRASTRSERLFHRPFQVLELALFLDLDEPLLEDHRHHPIPVPSSERNAQTLERETGIEPATNSLEGCDSTTELLPLSLETARSLRPERSGFRLRAPAFADARTAPELLEPMIRIELMTSPLPRECSTN